MINRSVPRAEWFRFFNSFTERHQGAPVSVTVAGEAIGVQREARSLALMGIVADRLASEISIVLGGPEGANVDHPIEEPVRVWVEMNDSGEETVLDIESQNGTRTIVEMAPIAVAGGV
jgi:hypothetical protein